MPVCDSARASNEVKGVAMKLKVLSKTERNSRIGLIVR